MEYLIKTYTNEGDTVLDNTMGSGTTGMVAKQLGRYYLGCELNEDYRELIESRVSDDKLVQKCDRSVTNGLRDLIDSV